MSDGTRAAYLDVGIGPRIGHDRAADIALGDYEQATELHGRSSVATLAAGGIAAATGIGSLVTSGRASNVLRGVATFAGAAAAVQALTSWYRYAHLDDKQTRASEASRAEVDVFMNAYAARQAAGRSAAPAVPGAAPVHGERRRCGPERPDHVP